MDPNVSKGVSDVKMEIVTKLLVFVNLVAIMDIMVSNVKVGLF